MNRASRSQYSSNRPTMVDLAFGLATAANNLCSRWTYITTYLRAIRTGAQWVTDKSRAAWSWPWLYWYVYLHVGTVSVFWGITQEAKTTTKKLHTTKRSYGALKSTEVTHRHKRVFNIENIKHRFHFGQTIFSISQSKFSKCGIERPGSAVIF